MSILSIYWILLTLLLVVPLSKNSVPQIGFWGHLDKLVHFFAFGILGFLFQMVFKKRFFIFFFILFLYGLLTEFLQTTMKMNRQADLLDILANVLGMVIGYILFNFFKSKIKNIK